MFSLYVFAMLRGLTVGDGEGGWPRTVSLERSNVPDDFKTHPSVTY